MAFKNTVVQRIWLALNNSFYQPLLAALDFLMGAAWGQVDLAATANLAGTYSSTTQKLTVTATGALSVDGVAVAVGDRVLLPAQSTGSQNGIYSVLVAGTTGVQPVLQRATDANASGCFDQGKTVMVRKGSTLAGKRFTCTFTAPFTLDTTTPTFTQEGTRLPLGRQVFTSGGTYTPTAGCNRVRLRMVGGGGGGGGVANSSAAQAAVGGGGASGAWFEKWIDPGAPIVGGAVTIGAAGTAGSAGAGGTGGDSSVVINSTTYTAKGGLGGAQGSSGTGSSVAGGNIQGGSTAGDVNGQDAGCPGTVTSGSVAAAGQGGVSPYGGVGVAPVAQGAGVAGNGNGSGGSGGCSINAGGAAAGGAGTAGLVIIEEYA